VSDWSGRRLHFIGIGGAGMSGLALVARALGAAVSGSDRAESATLARLREEGIGAVAGHDAAHVPDGAEVVYSTAVGEDNPERAAARERGLRELHRADLLAEVTALPGRRCIAVTGTHGKTTTTSMVVHALRGCGMDPGYLVGGEVRSTGSNAGWGAGEWVVVEADESDRSLLRLHPDVAVLTNAELDHHATYASLREVEETFQAFLARAREGVVVWDRPTLRALAPASGPEVVAYDVPSPLLDAAGARFDWRGIAVRLAIPGAHNALNAAAALEACRLAGADPARAAAALADFRGAGRRFELLGTTSAGVRVYDDYAHHPTEVAAAIAAARTLAPARVVAVFQPHLYSRTEALARPFGAALAAADVVVALDVYPARERAEDFPGVTGKLLADAAADAGGGRRVAWMPGFDAAAAFLRAELRPGDVCLMMGAGDVDALGRRLLCDERPGTPGRSPRSGERPGTPGRSPRSGERPGTDALAEPALPCHDPGPRR
jgi:UDP-N-acetylmuramate--alanine ligase